MLQTLNRRITLAKDYYASGRRSYRHLCPLAFRRRKKIKEGKRGFLPIPKGRGFRRATLMIYNLTLKPTEIKLMPASTVEEILQNVRTIIRTMRGSVPMYREFGMSTELIDAPANVVRSRFMAAAVEAINRFEPRAKLKKILWQQSDAADGKVDFLIQVEV